MMMVSAEALEFLIGGIDEIPAMFDSVAGDVDKLAATFRETAQELKKKIGT